jgi:hypothetical protein
MKKILAFIAIISSSLAANAQLQYQTTLLTTTSARGKVVKPQISLKNAGTMAVNLTWKANDKATYIPKGFNAIGVCLYPAGLCFQYNAALFAASSNRDFTLAAGDSVFFLVDMDITDSASLDSTCKVGVSIDEGGGIGTAIAFHFNAVNWPTNITSNLSNSQLALYPTVASNDLTVATVGVAQKIVFTDICGKVLQTIVPANDKPVVSVAQFANGQYLAQVYGTNGKITVQKFFVCK